MADIITRETGIHAKGSELTNEELDNNFININEELTTLVSQQASTSFLSPLCLNNTGITITTGTIVMIIGVLNDQFLIAPAITNGTLDYEIILGIASEDILDAATSNIVVQGIVQNLNLNVWASGTKLYADPSNNGVLTNIKPADTAMDKAIAFILKQSTDANLDGEIYVKMVTV